MRCGTLIAGEGLSSSAGLPAANMVLSIQCIYNAMQVRPGNVLEMKGRLLQVVKFQHTQGAGRQLGNVQATLDAGTISRKTLKTPCTHTRLASAVASYTVELSPG